MKNGMNEGVRCLLEMCVFVGGKIRSTGWINGRCVKKHYRCSGNAD